MLRRCSVRDEPADVHRDDEADHRVVADGVNPRTLDGEPSIVGTRTDLVAVVLAVAAVVQRDPCHEARARHRNRRECVVPRERDRRGEPGVLELGEHDGPAAERNTSGGEDDLEGVPLGGA